MDRMIRGAYSGRLYPGRTNSCDPKEQVDGNFKTEVPLVRIHSECYTGETAWSARCDCGEQLDEAARLMSEAGEGVIVYLRQEGRGIGLGEKLKYTKISFSELIPERTIYKIWETIPYRQIYYCIIRRTLERMV
jgi:GTP cyclohydrolase II